MSITDKFRTLIQELDDEALEDLRGSVDRELGARQPHSSIKLEDIHPRMSAAEKEQASQEIARLLREGR